MTWSCPASAMAWATGASLTNCGRAPTTLSTFTRTNLAPPTELPVPPPAPRARGAASAAPRGFLGWSCRRYDGESRRPPCPHPRPRPPGAVFVKIVVVALGKIGLPLAVQFASKGHEVVGVDVNAALVDVVNQGREPFPG